jgi:UDP-GlcNAc:undecaprenyl-phosphate GlcNAc-1-phosphate transferase
MSALGFFTTSMFDLPETASFGHVAYGVLLAFGLSLTASFVLTPVVRWLAHRQGWLDRPDGVRKQHAAPIPRIGGLAVYASFLAAVCGAVMLLPGDPQGGVSMTRSMVHLLIASTLVMLVGLLDDIRGVRPLGKIAAQATAGLYLFLHGYDIAKVTNPFSDDPFRLGWLALPVTVLWFVAMSNAFNLIDGLDGLAAGLGLFATATLAVSAVLNGRWSTVVVLCALAGALLGFLRYNFNPASVFLGDSGALFVGFVLAGLAIRSSMKASAVVALGVPLCALALPILDVAIATLRRLATGHRVFEADHEHIHHRLVRRGLSPRRAVVSLYGVAAIGGSLSLVTISGSTQVIWGSVCVVALLAWAGLRELGYAEFGEFGKLLARRYLPGRQTVANNALLRQLRSDLARAQSLGGLWDALVDGVRPLEFQRIEIDLAGDLAARAPHNGDAPRHAFPVWQSRQDQNGSERPSWGWTVSIGDASSPQATITLTRLASESELQFDPTYLIQAIRGGFADFLARH